MAPHLNMDLYIQLPKLPIMYIFFGFVQYVYTKITFLVDLFFLQNCFYFLLLL